MRLLLDTNILIAAALGSKFAEDIILLTIKSKDITLVTSEEILTELKNKLLSKFDKSEENVDFFVAGVIKMSEMVEVTEKVSIVIRDPSDNKILECALSGKADLIVTADQDLIKLKKFKGIGIVHPKTLNWILPQYFKKKQN